MLPMGVTVPPQEVTTVNILKASLLIFSLHICKYMYIYIYIIKKLLPSKSCAAKQFLAGSHDLFP